MCRVFCSPIQAILGKVNKGIFWKQCFQQDSKNCSDKAAWDGQYWTDGQDLTRLKTGLGFDRMDWTAQN